MMVDWNVIMHGVEILGIAATAAKMFFGLQTSVRVLEANVSNLNNGIKDSLESLKKEIHTLREDIRDLRNTP